MLSTPGTSTRDRETAMMCEAGAAGERGSHLAAGAEEDEIAGERREGGAVFGVGLGEEGFEFFFGVGSVHTESVEQVAAD